MEPKHHILNASSNLLGISLLIIAGLHISHNSQTTLADEVAWVSSICFAASCCMSYLSIRKDNAVKTEALADKVFLIGVFCLLVSVAVLATSGMR